MRTLTDDDLSAIEQLIARLMTPSAVQPEPRPVTPGSFMARMQQAEQELARKGGK